MISTIGPARIGSVRASVVLPTGWAQRDVIAHTTMSRKHTLKISEGWIDSGPNTTQRRAPDTVRPSTKTAASPIRPSR